MTPNVDRIVRLDADEQRREHAREEIRADMTADRGRPIALSRRPCVTIMREKCARVLRRTPCARRSPASAAAPSS
jgi:hypothetical protein